METLSKLVCVVMGQNCDKFIKMCIQSIHNADAIIYLDGGSKDKTLEIIKEFGNVLILENKWDKTDKVMNGKQRNFYLNYLKNNFQGWWALVLDADEIVENLDKVKEFINQSQNEDFGALCVKMRHFIGSLGWEDASRETHYVPNRLFRIDKAIDYPLHSHPILNTEGIVTTTECTTIFHLGHLPIEYMIYIVNRSKQHKEDSIIHDRQFLDWWQNAHLFGKYPTKEINPREVPKLIYEGLGIDFDEIYSSQEQIEFKHHLMVKSWNDYFKPKSVLDLGCGRGCYLYYWNWFVEEAIGLEINKWAIKNAFVPNIKEGDIAHGFILPFTPELTTCIDVLEHLNDKDLNLALSNLAQLEGKFIFSIPFIGDPNLQADKTHKQFKTKEEWIKLIESHGIKIKETPKDWLFHEQIIIGEK